MLILIFDTEEERNRFLYLHETYSLTIMNTIQRFVSDTYDAEDLYQEILILHAKHINEMDFSDYKRARNYVITLSSNLCKNYLKKQKRKIERIEFYDDADDYTGEENGPLDWVLEKDAFENLIKELDQLGDKYRMVLELKYVNGFDDDSIAKELGITKKNVQMRIYRGKALLKERLYKKAYGKK